MENKYISDYSLTGECVINVNEVCKDWNDKFQIATWINDAEEKYTLVIMGKRKEERLLKVQISKMQAMEVVYRINLVHVKSPITRSGGSYRSVEFVKKEIERIKKIKEEKEREIDFIYDTLSKYKGALELNLQA